MEQDECAKCGARTLHPPSPLASCRGGMPTRPGERCRFRRFGGGEVGDPAGTMGGLGEGKDFAGENWKKLLALLVFAAAGRVTGRGA